MPPETGLSYGRASRDPKRRGASVSTQLRENERWATANGVVITHTIRDDDRSASAYRKREREGFEEALDLIRGRAVDVALVWEMSRASRDLEDYVRLRSACHDAGVHLVYKGRRFDLTRADDRLSTGLDALLAEREASDIRDRNLRTVATNADSAVRTAAYRTATAVSTNRPRGCWYVRPRTRRMIRPDCRPRLRFSLMPPPRFWTVPRCAASAVTSTRAVSRLRDGRGVRRWNTILRAS